MKDAFRLNSNYRKLELTRFESLRNSNYFQRTSWNFGRSNYPASSLTYRLHQYWVIINYVSYLSGDFLVFRL